MGVFDELLKSLEARSNVPGLSSDFSVAQNRPNVYTPPAYPSYTPVQQTQPTQQVPFSPYPSAPTLADITAYGNQIANRPATPFTPPATPVTDKYTEDTIAKLVGAKANRVANIMDLLAAGQKPTTPGISDALATANALNDYYGGGDGASSDGSSAGPGSGPGSAGSLGSLGLGRSEEHTS